MAWLILILAGLLEVVWALALKQTHGFTRLGPTVLACSTALLSFVLLSLALRSLPVGTAYAVWVGVGAVGVTLAGIVALGESLSPARLAFVALIAIGIVGLKAVDT
ncbi:quaternary ammonium compound efflux SMR transporter SugE [Plantactinospora endophytica]|uniref:SugE protein n=1 Tax=Plantactinospora endophytica TaxID=673535 RepID=A0ABQ4E991_9ACTN|nr:quaternary ammonium compound efflux SMR transporter SugE [Plantactinospora endophytica]GIG91299.1 SugE protein [Plantactinospora endophytica]